MYAGHFASALALKGRYPETPTWALVFGVGLLDILFGPFVLIGIETVTMTPGISPGFRLDHIDWSHSLLMSVVWSIGFGVLFFKKGRQVAVVAGAAVFSHYLLDLIMHPGDLALWPGSSIHWGFGLWRLAGAWWFIELAFIAVSCTYYWFKSKGQKSFGRHAAWAIAVILALHLMNSPWLSPSG